MPQNAIRKTPISDVLENDIVEGLGAVARTHSIDVNDNKSEFCKGLVRRNSTVCFRHKRTLWARVDVFDHGIFLGWIEIQRTDDYAPDVRFPVAAFRNEYFWIFEACRAKSRIVAL